jgi:hypothetical protein
MTHKPAVGIGGFGRDNTSELINRSPYIASAAPSSSPSSKAPPPLPRLAAEQTAASDRMVVDAEITVFEKRGGRLTKRILKHEIAQQTDWPAKQAPALLAASHVA